MEDTLLFEERSGLEKLQKLRSRETPERSIKWYKENIRKLGLNTVSANAVMGSNLGTLTSSIVPGDMFLFFYDPKTKDSLPYYDTVPLVLPFRSAKGGFYGLNLHYLPSGMRVQLLDRLMAYTTGDGLTDNTRFRVKWSILNNAAKFPGVESCVKRYLYSQVRSRFLRINPLDWKKTILLPLDSFVKASAQKVHSDSRSRS